MDGGVIGTLLTRISTESPYLPSGTARLALLLPTLYVRGQSTTTFYNCGSSTIHGSYVIQTARGTTESELVTILTAFDRTWGNNWDTIPTNFEVFPTTSLLSNKLWWGTSGLFRKKGKGRKGKEVYFSLRSGQHLDIVQRSSAKFTWADYAANSIAPIPADGMPAPSALSAGFGGFFKNRTSNIVYRVQGELGQVCGTNAGEPAPILTTTAGQFMIRDRAVYSYKWAPGNNKPSVYGNYLGPNEVVLTTANGFIGVPEQKAMRPASRFSPAVDFGGLDIQSRMAVNINSIKDCAGNAQTPEVGIVGQPIEVVIS